MHGHQEGSHHVPGVIRGHSGYESVQKPLQPVAGAGDVVQQLFGPRHLLPVICHNGPAQHRSGTRGDC